MPGEVPFVGRDAELARLRTWSAEAAAGAPRIVLVTGEAGAGKSALVAEVAAGLAREGFATGTGGCVDIPGLEQAQLPYGPFVEALRRVDDGTLAERWLAGAVADPPTGGVPTGDPSAGAQARFDAALRVVGGAAAERPLLLVLEDLQWADRSSLALLVHLARNLTTEPVLVAATVRTGGAEATVDHLARVPPVRRLDLEPLPDDAVRRLVRSVAGPGADVDAVVERAEGNPLVAVELGRHASPAGTVPATLAASVRDRVRRSPPRVRGVLAAAAALGRRADHGLLVALLEATAPDGDERDSVAAVHEAAGTGILRADGDGYAFRHGLDRDVVYADLLPGERRALHAAAADALAGGWRGRAVPAGVLAEIAEHRLRSGDHTAAFAACLAAGRAAAAIDAHAEASVQLDRALELWSPGAAPLTDLMLEAAEAARWSGQVGRADELLADALRRAATPAERARILERAAWFRRRMSDHVELAARAVEELGSDRESATAAAVLATYATVLTIGGDHAAARDVAREALEVAERSGAEEARVAALTTSGSVAGWLGDLDEGLRLFRAAEAAADRAGLREQRWRACGNRLAALAISGRFREAAEEFPEILARAGDPREAPYACLALYNGAVALIELGRWAEGEAVVTRVLAVESSPYERSGLLAVLAALALRRGDVDAAAAHLRAAAGLLGPEDDAEALAEERLLAARVAAARGDLTRARALIDEALGLSREANVLVPLLVVTEALRLEAEHGSAPGDRAPGRVARLCEIADRCTYDPARDFTDRRIEGLACRAEAARARAAAGEPGAGERQAWRDLADKAERDGLPWYEAYARLQLARVLLARGRRAGAATALARAAALARDLGAAPLVADAEALARRARLPDAARDGASPRAVAAGLTPREADVLEQLVAGETNRRIARSLGISERTASVHVSRILAKLGVRSRGEAAAAARRLALLDDDSSGDRDVARPAPGEPDPPRR
jgi:DNA-binding CsgD family transcriptional regulator